MRAAAHGVPFARGGLVVSNGVTCSEAGDSVRFYLLGSIAMERRGRSLQVARPRQRAVLGFLLLQANRLVSTDALAEAVWGGAAPSTAKTQLQADVSAIRKAIGASDAADVVRTERAGYRLIVEPLHLDLHEFDRLVQQARSAYQAQDAAAVAHSLETALALWRGPALANASAHYIEAERARLEEQRRTAREDLAEARLMLDRSTDVIPTLVSLVNEAPLRERACGLLMTALCREGRQAEALGVARRMRRLLAEEHGLDLTERIRELEMRILRAEPATIGGWHGVPSNGGRLVPAQLPPAVSPFVGRSDELKLMDAAIAAGKPPGPVVLALAGPAGVGKTALAMRWAHLSSARFPDGQLYVNLQGYSAVGPLTPLAALAALLRGLGLPSDQIPLDVEEAAATYRSLLAGRKMLVVLDNCRDGPQVRPLLPGYRECVTVVTSRDSMSGLVARDGAVRIDVGLLPPGDSVWLLACIVGTDRVSGAPEHALVLAGLCGHLPLALRIVAARLANDSDRDIVDEVKRLSDGNRLPGLTVGNDRDACVGYAIDQTYLTLPPATRRFFGLLSLVPSPDITADAAAALAQVTSEATGRALSRLTGVHLLRTAEPGRYAFHDLVRHFARVKVDADIEPGERASCVRHLLSFYLARATRAATLLYPQMLRIPVREDHDDSGDGYFVDGAAASAWLDAERHNLVATVTFAAEHGPRPMAWRLADAMRGYFFTTMHTVDWFRVASAALAAATLDADLIGQAAAQMSLGGLYWRQGRHDESLRHHSRASAIAEAAGWVECEAATLGNIGTVHAELGALDDATDHFQRALTVNSRLGWRQGIAVNHVNLGLVYRMQGCYQAAAEHYERARQLYRELRSPSGEGICGTNLGEMLVALGQTQAARDRLTEALALHRSVGDRANEAETTRCLAALHRDNGHLADALRTGTSAVTLSREVGHSRFEAEAVATVASIHHAMGRYDEALAGWLPALQQIREVGNCLMEAETMLGLAETLRMLGFTDEAATHVEGALRLAEQRGHKPLAQRAREAASTGVLRS
jgi:DNA-binding SARP family transcriptional activator/tetratricopeptide (TPR) repeat protein